MKTQALLTVLPVVFTLGSAFAQTAAERLEQGVQLQTADGNLEAAIAEYKEVLKSAARGNRLAAEARYRLAECFSKLGNTERMNDHLKSLREDFPANNKWVIKGVNLAPVETHFHGTPWSDGKLNIYGIKFPNGKMAGHFLTGAIAVNDAAGDGWAVVTVRTAGGSSLSSSRFLTEGYQPLESRWFISAFGDVSIQYDEKRVATIRNVETGEVKGVYDHQASKDAAIPLIENEQAIQLIRALDQEIGTKQKTVILAAHNGGIPITFDLEVTAHEEVTVEAGTFHCAKIESSIKQSFYVSLGENRELVRMDVGAAKIDLMKSEPWDGKTPKLVKAEHQGASFVLPGIMVTSPPVSKEDIFRMEVWSGDFAGRSGLIEINQKKNLVEEAQVSSRAYATVLHEGYAKNFDAFEIVDDEWDTFKIDGVDAVGMMVRRKLGERQDLEYEIHALGEKLALSFRMDFAEVDTEKAKARMMEVVETFQWGQ